MRGRIHPTGHDVSKDIEDDFVLEIVKSRDISKIKFGVRILENNTFEGIISRGNGEGRTYGNRSFVQVGMAQARQEISENHPDTDVEWKGTRHKNAGLTQSSLLRRDKLILEGCSERVEVGTSLTFSNVCHQFCEGVRVALVIEPIGVL